jgi:Flp pilus assembly protein TadD
MQNMIRALGMAALIAGVPLAASAEPLKGQASDLAYSAIETGNWSKAETQLRSELAASPDDAMRLVNLAYVLQRQGRDGEAVELYRKVLSLNSNPVVAVGADERDLKGVRVKSIANKGIASIKSGK